MDFRLVPSVRSQAVLQNSYHLDFDGHPGDGQLHDGDVQFGANELRVAAGWPSTTGAPSTRSQTALANKEASLLRSRTS
jgi:hypothetical protein